MYLPDDFREDRIEKLHELMRRVGFATLVTIGHSGPEASHIPMFFDPEPTPFGTLRAHVARANPQWREAKPELPSLAIFVGPHHYISPSWYPSTSEHGRMVPTWNYAVVHARGPLRAVEDKAWLRRHLDELVGREEAHFEKPWRVSGAPVDYIERMLTAIVGLELKIEHLEGKWKLGQNRTAQDRAGAVAGLRSVGALEIADLMEHQLPG